MFIDSKEERDIERLLSTVSEDANHIPYDQMLLRRLVENYSKYLSNTYNSPYMTLYEFSLGGNLNYEYYGDLLKEIDNVIDLN
jgi:hypothetical protein